MQTTTFLTELPTFLTWQSGTDLLKQSCSSHIHWMWRRLHEWTAAHDRDIWDAVIALPASSQARLLLAPQCFHLLGSMAEPTEAHLASLRTFVAMEQHLLATDDRTAPPAAWTALGDCYSGDGQSRWTEDAPAGEPEPHRPFRAAMVGRIVLDAYSPHHNAALSPPADLKLGEYRRCSPAEAAAAGQRIAAGIDYVRAMSPCAATMVHNAVQVLQIGTLAGQPSYTGSCSWRGLVGAIGLTNADGLRWHRARVAEALVHESIHQTIYKLELSSELFTDLDAASTLTTVSPWSGRALKMTSFVHACFVWFGLWNFWRLCPAADEGVAQLHARAHRGFEAGPPLASLSREATACVAPAARDAIVTAYELVKAAA